MKKLLASGCSWTDANYNSALEFLLDNERGGWPMWPELLGKELGLEAINTGLSGKGNVYIAQSIIDNIIKYGNEVEMVAVLWTEVSRYDVYKETAIALYEQLNYHNLQIRSRASNSPRKHEASSEGCSYNNPFDWDIEDFRWNDVYNTWNNNTLRAMYTIAEMCAHRNIKCVFDQGVIFFWHRELAEIKSYIHADMFITEVDYMVMLETSMLYQRLMKDYGHLFVMPKAIIDYKDTIGYLLHHCGKNRKDLQIYMPEHLNDNDVVKNYNNLNAVDSHPNAAGQKFISERYLQCLKKYY